MLVYQTKRFPHFSTPDTPVSTGILIFCVSLIFAEVLSPAERRVSTAFTGQQPMIILSSAVWKETDFDFSSKKFTETGVVGGCVTPNCE